jgi:hypothetical protein
MNIETAKQYAASLLRAVERAQADGRDELLKSDMDVFTSDDDDARSELQHAIDQQLI